MSRKKSLYRKVSGIYCLGDLSSATILRKVWWINNEWEKMGEGLTYLHACAILGLGRVIESHTQKWEVLC